MNHGATTEFFSKLESHYGETVTVRSEKSVINSFSFTIKGELEFDGLFSITQDGTTVMTFGTNDIYAVDDGIENNVEIVIKN